MGGLCHTAGHKVLFCENTRRMAWLQGNSPKPMPGNRGKGAGVNMNICIVGAFDFVHKDTNGQSVKSRELYNALFLRYGKENVSTVETYRWKRNPFRLAVQLLRKVPASDTIIMLPANNGVKVFSWLLRVMKKKSAKLYYDVVGGWLPEMAQKDPALVKNLKRFDDIWVEATSMQCRLKELGIEKVRVIPNFKNLDVLTNEQLKTLWQPPYPLCTFSRVMEEKGITDAMEAVRRANEQMGQKMYTLDIYGPVAPEYEEKFAQLQVQYADSVCYKGVADPKDSVQILKNYFALLFPTYYSGEGFAGTLLDAMASGTPVIASDWRYNAEIVKDGVTGVIHPTKDMDALVQHLCDITQRVDWWNSLRPQCLEEARKYQPSEIISKIVELIEEKDSHSAELV